MEKFGWTPNQLDDIDATYLMELISIMNIEYQLNQANNGPNQ